MNDAIKIELLQHLFYFIADVYTCAINAAIYFIVAFI